MEKTLKYKIMENLNQSTQVKKNEHDKVSIKMEYSLKEIIHLFQQLCDIPHFIQDIQEKLINIEEELKYSEKKLIGKPLPFQVHYQNINTS